MKKKKLFKEILFYLIVFILFLALFYFIPFTGDDWQNYGNGKFGLINILRNSYRYYLTWEGRIGSRIIIFLVTFNKWLWNIIASISIIGIIYFSSKLIDETKKKITLVFLLSLIFLINYEMFVQCFFWIAGNVTYTVCTALFIFYLFYVFNKIELNKEFNLIEKILLFGLNIYMCTFVENIAAGILVANLLVLINSFFVKKDKNKYYIVTFIASLIGLLIQILSPGTGVRISLEMGEFGKLNLIQKIIYNLSNFVEFEFLINPIMIFIMVIAFDLLIFIKEKNLVRKILIVLFMNIIPILTIICNLNLIFPFEFNILNHLSNFLSFINNSDNVIIIVYWIMFVIVYFICIFLYLKNDIIKTKLIILYLTSQSCILAMLVTPTWSNRVAFATVILNYIVALLIFKCLNVNYNKLFKKSIYCFCTLYLGVLLVLYYNVYCCINYRDNYIIEHYQNGDRVIDYYVVSDRLLWSQYPYSNSYKNAFNGILGIEDDVEYIEKGVDFKYKIFFHREV